MVTTSDMQGNGFSFDNEGPSHKALLQPFALADRLVTNRRLALLHRGRRLSPPPPCGWPTAGTPCEHKRLDRPALLGTARRRDGLQMGLHGLLAGRCRRQPVSQPQLLRGGRLRALGRTDRLPTEFEWEHAALILGETHRTDAPRVLYPVAPDDGDRQMFGAGLAMDAERLPALPALPRRPRRDRRVQRQVHVRPAGAARILLRDLART